MISISLWGCVGKALAWRHAVLVDHPQGSKAHMARIIVVAEGKAVSAVEPAEVRFAAIF
jgi:hypothetical protein